MCTNPSTPGANLTKHPKAATRVTVPLWTLPTAKSRSAVSQGFSKQVTVGKRNLCRVFVDPVDLHLDLLADLQHFAGMLDAVPTQLADVDQPVETSQIHEGAEILDASNGAIHQVARLRSFQVAPCVSLRAPAPARHVGSTPGCRGARWLRSPRTRTSGRRTRWCPRPGYSLIWLIGMKPFTPPTLHSSPPRCSRHGRFDNRALIEVFPVGDVDRTAGQTQCVQAVLTTDTPDDDFDRRSNGRLLFELLEGRRCLHRDLPRRQTRCRRESSALVRAPWLLR